MSTTRTTLAAVGLMALATTTCSTTATVNATFNFTRATDVAFVCFSVPPVGSSIAPLEIRPLSDCVLAAADNTPTVNPLYHLHALVTQSERGELAVVDLAATAAISLVDTRSSIPGYTFVPVGPSPTAVVADYRPSGPSAVWVASGGSRSVQRLDPRALQRSVIGEIPLNGAPFDIAIDTVGDHHFLYASVPDRQAIAVINIDDVEHPNNLGFVSLGATSGGDAGMDAGTGSQRPARPLGIALDTTTHRLYASDDASGYLHVVGFAPGGGASMPMELEQIMVGGPTRNLVVTPRVRESTICNATVDPDHCAEGQYLYAISGLDGAVFVYDLVRRERVRANLLPAPNPTRRLVDPANGSEFRVPLPAPAVTLTVIATSDYVPPGGGTPVIPCESAATGCPAGVNASPGQLHGLFVGALLRNGQFSLIDLDDYDAECRRRNCNTTPVREVDIYRMIRHAPRSAVALDRPPSIVSRPTLTSSVLGGDRTVVAESPGVPTIACEATRGLGAPTCDSNFGIELTPLEEGSAADCDAGASTDAGDSGPDPDASTDASTGSDGGTTDASQPPADVGPVISSAYSTQNESWGMTFEGTLPGLDLQGGALRVEGGGDTLVLNADGAGFCTRGTLAVPGHHDTATLVGEVTPTTGMQREACASVFGSAAQPTNRDFRIASASQINLTLDLPAELSGDEARSRASRLLVTRCFAQSTRFQVRATDQWVLFGQRTGFPHAVVADASGQCVVDADRQRAVDLRASTCLRGRVPTTCRGASSACPAGRACLPGNVNGMSIRAEDLPITATPGFCLQVYPGVQPTASGAVQLVRPLRDMQFVFSITGAYTAFTVETGMFPSTAHFLPAYNRLYVVDQGNTGLLEFRTNPVTRSRLFN